jgi:hypothetical protein
MPVPVTATLCGLPEALSVNVTLNDRAPVVVGSKTTVMTHPAFGASVPLQPNETEKSPGFVPVLLTVKVSVPVPVLVTLKVCVELAVPTA